MVDRRSTTVNHMFASALAPFDAYDDELAKSALTFLRQDPDGQLSCVYCGGLAETWDHLVGLVKSSGLQGFGHQIGNLVPSCKGCNSEKGSKDWRVFLAKRNLPPAKRRALGRLLTRYQRRFAREVDLKRAASLRPRLWRKYQRLRAEVLALMEEADMVATKLRPSIMTREA